MNSPAKSPAFALSAPQNTPSLRYRDSGVNIDAGNDLAERIKPIARRTHGAGVLGGLGGFGALYQLPLERFRNPVLVSATDGVGTKLKLAAMMARDDTVGIDLVAMCVNDIIVYGAEPLYFLDYFATGALQVERAEAVISGIARGCALAGCALAGGETAEMPGMYAPGEYDLAGFAVGVVDKDNLLDAANVQVGDVVLGLGSSGPHANGFSLIRKILEIEGDDLSRPFADATLGETLLEPTRIYVKPLLRLLAEVEVSAIAHITGGGLLENPPRVLPQGVVAEIHRSSWPLPAIFEWLRQGGNLDETEMLRTFNCGIGLMVVVPEADATRAVAILEAAGEIVFPLGQIRRGRGQPRVVVLD